MTDIEQYHRLEKEHDRLMGMIPQVETLFDYLETRKQKVEEEMEQLLPYLPGDKEDEYESHVKS